MRRWGSGVGFHSATSSAALATLLITAQGPSAEESWTAWEPAPPFLKTHRKERRRCRNLLFERVNWSLHSFFVGGFIFLNLKKKKSALKCIPLAVSSFLCCFSFYQKEKGKKKNTSNFTLHMENKKDPTNKLSLSMILNSPSTQ